MNAAQKLNARVELLTKLEDILQASPITPETVLEATSFDSMAIVMIVAEIDILFQLEVSGIAVGACVTVNDILKLAGF